MRSQYRGLAPKQIDAPEAESLSIESAPVEGSPSPNATSAIFHRVGSGDGGLISDQPALSRLELVGLTAPCQDNSTFPQKIINAYGEREVPSRMVP